MRQPYRLNRNSLLSQARAIHDRPYLFRSPMASAFYYKTRRSGNMMHLTHRNRVAYSRLNRLEIQRCGPPSPAGRANAAYPSCSFIKKGNKKSPPSPAERANAAHPSCSFIKKGGKKSPFRFVVQNGNVLKPFTNHQTVRMRPSPPRWGGGTAASKNREYLE